MWDLEFKDLKENEAEVLPVAPGEEGDGFIGDSKLFLKINGHQKATSKLHVYISVS